jgi:hypothetical protein
MGDLTVVQLRQIARDRRLPGYSTMRKAELEAALADPITVEFDGPALSVRLPAVPAGPVEATRDGVPVEVDVDGDRLRRTGGHFGRGRWTVTYIS